MTIIETINGQTHVTIISDDSKERINYQINGGETHSSKEKFKNNKAALPTADFQIDFENEAKLSKEACMSYFNSSFNHKKWFKNHTFCNNFSISQYFDIKNLTSQEKLNDYTKCINKNEFLDEVSTEFVADCTRDSVQQRVFNVNFPVCYKNLKLLNFKEIGYDSIFNTCTTSYDFEILASKEFEICNKKISPFEKSSERIFKICTATNNLKSIVSSDFDICTERLKNGGVYTDQLLKSCLEADSQKIIVSEDFEKCEKAIKAEGMTKDLDRHLLCSDPTINKIAQINPKCFVSSQKTSHRFYIYYAFQMRSSNSNYDKNYLHFLSKDCENPSITNQVPTLSNKNSEVKMLNFIKEINIHSKESFYDKKSGHISVGGLSALSYDSNSKLLYALSDDNSNNFMGNDKPPRIYTYRVNSDLSLSENHVTFLQKFTLKAIPIKSEIERKKTDKDSKTVNVKMEKVIDKDLQIDPEGMYRLSNGYFIISSETAESKYNKKNEKYYNLNVFNENGEWLSYIDLPESYKTKTTTIPSTYQTIDPKNPKKTIKVETTRTNTTHGLTFNKSLEALTLSPDENQLFIANEGPLLQDMKTLRNCYKAEQEQKEPKRSELTSKFSYGKVNYNNDNGYSFSNGEKKCGGSVRIVNYQREHENVVLPSPSFKANLEYRYDLDLEKDNGLVELLAIDTNRLLALERGYDHVKQEASGKLYLVELTADSLIRSDTSLDENTLIPGLKKTLILDLSKMVKEFAPGFRVLDNYEGLSWGPTMPNGNPTLIFVSDNNFSDKQRSSFLTFEVSQELQNLGIVQIKK